jgi:hypothetical protein
MFITRIVLDIHYAMAATVSLRLLKNIVGMKVEVLNEIRSDAQSDLPEKITLIFKVERG